MYKNFSFIGVQIWNDVQKHINVSMSFSSLKKSTRTYYLYNNPKYIITSSLIIISDNINNQLILFSSYIT